MSHRSKTRHDARMASTFVCKDCGQRCSVTHQRGMRCGACFIAAPSSVFIIEQRARDALGQQYDERAHYAPRWKPYPSEPGLYNTRAPSAHGD